MIEHYFRYNSENNTVIIISQYITSKVFFEAAEVYPSGKIIFKYSANDKFTRTDATHNLPNNNNTYVWETPKYIKIMLDNTRYRNHVLPDWFLNLLTLQILMI